MSNLKFKSCLLRPTGLAHRQVAQRIFSVLPRVQWSLPFLPGRRRSQILPLFLLSASCCDERSPLSTKRCRQRRFLFQFFFVFRFWRYAPRQRVQNCPARYWTLFQRLHAWRSWGIKLPGNGPSRRVFRNNSNEGYCGWSASDGIVAIALASTIAETSNNKVTSS